MDKEAWSLTSDTIYCKNEKCLHTDCKRHLVNVQPVHGLISEDGTVPVAPWHISCQRYISECLEVGHGK